MIALAAALAVLAALPDGASEAAAPAPVERIAQVEFRAPPGEDRGILLAATGLGPDMPLEPRSVRAALRALHKLGRFSSILAWRVPVRPGWARLVFELVPRRRVVDVRIEGAMHVPEAELKRQINIAPGAAYRQDVAEAAAEAMRALLGRAGYRRAEVHADPRGEPDVELVYIVKEGPPTTISHLMFEGTLPLPEAELRAALGMNPGDIFALPRLEEGMEAVRVRLREAGYLRGRVGPAEIVDDGQTPDRVGVVVPVIPGPRISFRFRGNASFPDALLREVMAYDGEELIDAALAAELGERIERFYEKMGFPRAQVHPREVASRPEASLVVYVIDEGPRLSVTRVDFPGARHFKPQQLRRVVHAQLEAEVPGTTWVFLEGRIVADPVGALDPALLDRTGVSGRVREPRPARFRAAPHEVWSRAVYQVVVQKIGDLYKGEGFLSAKVGPANLVPDPGGRTARVEIPVEEGVRTLVREVRLEGNSDIPREELLQTIRLRPGDPMAQYAVEESRLRILQLYSSRGYLYARAEDVELLTEDKAGAVVQYNIVEGPRVRVGEILFRGIERTQPFVVAEHLTFKTGDVYDPAAVQRCQNALLRLGIFRAVAIGPKDPEVPAEVKDVLVQVREGERGSGDVVADVSTAEGPRLFGNYNQANIGGLALDLTAALKLSYDVFDESTFALRWYDGLERRLDVGLRYPRFHTLPFDLGGRLDLIHERDNRPAFGLTRFSGVGALDYSAGRELTASLAAELEFDRFQISSDIESLVDSASAAERQSARLPEGDLLLASLRPAMTVDLRDNPTHPTEGILANLSVEYAKDLRAVDRAGDPFLVHFVKVSALFNAYLALPRAMVLAFSARGGRVFSVEEESVTIGPKRFYLGGATSIRGFGEEALIPEDRRKDLQGAVRSCLAILTGLGCPRAASRLIEQKPVVSEGGNVYMAFKGELRVPLSGELEGGLFVDAGNLWIDPAQVAMRLRPAAGAGLRYSTPIGSMALDVGFNLDRDALLNEELFKVHFFIGLF